MGYMTTHSGSTSAWYGMECTYHKMGLSEEEIAHRIICKGDRVLEVKGNLDECDRE